MKKSIKFLAAVAAVAGVAVSCERDIDNGQSASKHLVSFTASAPETRTAFGDMADNKYPTLWEGNEKVLIFTAAGETAEAAAEGAGKSTSFNNVAIGEADTYYAVSPASATVDGTTVEIPAVQSAAEGSCDAAAQILFGCGEADDTADNVALAFKHVTAYGKLSLDGLPENAGELKAVTLTTGKTALAGTYTLTTDGEIAVSEGVNSLTVAADGEGDIWFACAPADLSDDELTVALEYEKFKYVKAIPSVKLTAFEAGKILGFGVKMESKPVVFDVEKLELLHSLSEPSYTLPLKETGYELTSSNDEVATVADGVVTFVKYGTVDIVAKIDETYSEIITLEIPAGYYNDYNNLDIWAKTPNHTGAVVTTEFNADTNETYLKVVPQDGSKYRADLVRSHKYDQTYTYLNRSEYPIICLRFDDLGDNVFGDKKASGRSIFIDTNYGVVDNGTAYDKDYRDWFGRIGGSGSNNWTKKYVCSDNSAIAYWDLNGKDMQNAPANPDNNNDKKLPENTVVRFDVFQLGYADIAGFSTVEDAAYRFFWFKTFKSVEEMEAYLNEWSAETQITFK